MRIYQCVSAVGGVDASIRMFKQQLQPCDWGGRFVILALKVAMLNDVNFVDIIVLYLLDVV